MDMCGSGCGRAGKRHRERIEQQISGNVEAVERTAEGPRFLKGMKGWDSVCVEVAGACCQQRRRRDACASAITDVAAAGIPSLDTLSVILTPRVWT
eukprot:137065-Chlamydomonas_euryale.AAC.1